VGHRIVGRVVVVGFLTSFLATLVACGTSLDGTPTADAAGAPSSSAGEEVEPAHTSEAGVTMISEFPGDGPRADTAACVQLDVRLKVADGDTHVTTPTGDHSMVVSLNDTRVIPGIRSGARGMRVGGRRALGIPPALAYGDHGWKLGGVPPGARLHADVTVLWAADPPKWSWESLHHAVSSGQHHLSLDEGSGPALEAGGQATALISSMDLKHDAVLKTGWPSCSAQAIDLGSSDVSVWFRNELKGLRSGGTRIVLKPSDVPAEQADAWLVTLVGVRN
ncbi:MAG: FKBP-type peptidyl-prolyl cis-trans isomerase, partial [Candidatus Microthrix parvicella]|jgi:peptidylprolyl isomerase